MKTTVTVNAVEFEKRTAHPQYGSTSYFAINFLGARGYKIWDSATKSPISQPQDRQGGIAAPEVRTIPSGAHLIRFFDHAGQADGCWWWTPWELLLLLKHAGHDDVSIGRSAGRNGQSPGTSLIHKAGVILADWQLLAHFRIVQFTKPFLAFFGEGDGADWRRTDERHGGIVSSYVKGLRVVRPDGSQRGVRQLYIPGFREYKDFVSETCQGDTDTSFVSELKKLAARPLPFET